MNYLPLLAFVVVIAVLIAIAGRARRKQAVVQAELASRIDVGSDVMTTSGLYGTVVTKNADDTVQLSIAPGVEVRWELAALRDVSSLPPKFGARLAPSDADAPDVENDPRDRVDFEKGDSGHSGETR